MIGRHHFIAFVLLWSCTGGAAFGQVFDPDVHGLGLGMGQYMRTVSGGGQPGGPAYTFDMGMYEVTNAQFAAFLNDAQLDGGATGRGSNMFFEANGDVRAAPGGPRLARAWPEQVPGWLHYDASLPVGQRYSAPTVNGIDWSPFPVINVSWLGATKFSNWLTIDQGFGEPQRAYTEGPNTEDWHPMSISTADWQVRDLNAAERQALVDNYLGFRLPMEDNSATTSTYNEWYKAAAWDPAAGVNHLYGFGRDTIDQFDANYNPNDPYGYPFNPFHMGSSTDVDWMNPVGFFDGSLRQRSDWNWPLNIDTFQTRANANAYGIYDLSGNVRELNQDQWALFGWIMTRGGFWAGESIAVQTTWQGHQPPTSTNTYTGFRIVRTPEPASVAFLIMFGPLLCRRFRKGRRGTSTKINN